MVVMAELVWLHGAVSISRCRHRSIGVGIVVGIDRGFYAFCALFGQKGNIPRAQRTVTVGATGELQKFLKAPQPEKCLSPHQQGPSSMRESTAPVCNAPNSASKSEAANCRISRTFQVLDLKQLF
jgi:hypothetical protein